MRIAARRASALLTLVALLGVAMSITSSSVQPISEGDDARPKSDAIAGLLVPKNVRLIIEFKRTAIA